MTTRAPASSTALAIAITALTFAPIVAAGQSGKPPATKGAGRSSGPKTPWGHPDLQGIWSNATTTPLERPSDLVGKEVLSDEEVARLDREVSGRRNTDQAPRQGDPGTYNEFWWERGNLLKQTALIIEPADGRVPALTSEGQRKVTARAQALKGRGPSDSWEDRNLHERCILYHGVPPLPTGYNNNYQIVQTPEYVAIRYEMLADTRIIPLDGRPHLNPKIRLWMGDPRGHWEGETLVVETTNFNAAAGGLYELGAVTPLQGTGETTRIVERFTRTDNNTIDYRFTVEDSTVFTKPWTGSIPLVKFDEKIYEYACHEGNYAMEHILSGARAEEAKSNSPKTNK